MKIVTVEKTIVRPLITNASVWRRRTSASQMLASVAPAATGNTQGSTPKFSNRPSTT